MERFEAKIQTTYKLGNAGVSYHRKTGYHRKELVNSDMSEGDYIIKAWGGIIEDIFRDNQLLFK
ncbi:unnamed protein product [Rhizopus stolonifer]